MITHALNIILGNHLADPQPDRFAVQFSNHLNTVLSDSGHQFELELVSPGDLPDPEPNPEILPANYAVHLYLFSNLSNPTQNGSLSITGNGDVRLFVPALSLPLVDQHGFYLPGYAQMLGTSAHEFEHVYRRGEPRNGAVFADPPADVPMPRVHLWKWEADPYWSPSKRRTVLDPLWCSQPIGHPLFAQENQDLAWLLENMRPSPGTCAIMRNGVRGAAPFSPLLNIVTPWNRIKPLTLRAWAAPFYFRDPWELIADKTNIDGGPFELAWPVNEFGGPTSPLVALQVEYEGQFAVGYVSIFDMEEYEAFRRDGATALPETPQVVADIQFRRIAMAGSEHIPDPWELHPRWATGSAHVRREIKRLWLAYHGSSSSSRPSSSSSSHS